MPPPDRSTRRSRKSKTKKGQIRTVEKNQTNVKPKEGFQRMDAVDKMPSNAPTMAIAPSDYEHIFHEGTGVGNPSQNPQAAPTGATNRQNGPGVVHSPSPPPPPLNIPKARTPEDVAPMILPPMIQPPLIQTGRLPYSAEVQVTPDGYTLLGHVPDPVNRRALPAHIVRASNQFSRAALVRVSRYLLSRAEYR